MPEINGIEDSGILHADTLDVTLDWTDPQLAAITRIRFIGDSWAGPFDLSYCLGKDTDGNQVRVRIPCYQVPGRASAIKRELVEAAKRDGVYLKGLCGDIGDVVSILW